MAEDEKQFEPTARHRQKMREQGEIAQSRDLVNASMLLVGMLLLWGFGSFFAEVPLRGAEQMWGEDPWLQMSPERFMTYWNGWMWAVFSKIVPILLMIPLTIAGVSLFQTQFLFLASRLKPDWKHVNPAEGLQRMFSLDAVAAAGFGVAKILLISTFILWMMISQLPTIQALCRMEFSDALRVTLHLVPETGLKIAGMLFFLSLADYGWQFYRHNQRLRMSYMQMKEEIRITEGDASMKQRMAQSRRK